jgi:DNA-binding HxlR family transcriptional regulator
MGKELVPIVQELTEWASKNLPTIMKHRQQFEA